MPSTFLSALRKRLLGDPVAPWRVMPVAALILWLPEGFEDWTPSVHALGVLFYLLEGILVWLCCTRLEPMLAARGITSALARLLAGALAIELGTWSLYGLICLAAFPAVTGARIEPHAFWQWWIHVTTVSLLVYGWHVLYRANSASDDELRRVSSEMAELDATLASAELALLEAQIEPHFLFNTLAHVKRDLKRSPRAADGMLGALILYLERAAPALRRQDWTIADELDLVAVYLGLLQQRFGDRLRFAIHAPESCRSFKLPALAVATLVENAVKHGLTPLPHGGTVRIEVVPDPPSPTLPGQAGVRISVIDDGVGLTPTQGTGLGLATVRARLRGAFGERAALTLEPRAAEGRAGVRSSIRIPQHA